MRNRELVPLRGCHVHISSYLFICASLHMFIHHLWFFCESLTQIICIYSIVCLFLIILVIFWIAILGSLCILQISSPSFWFIFSLCLYCPLLTSNLQFILVKQRSMFSFLVYAFCVLLSIPFLKVIKIISFIFFLKVWKFWFPHLGPKSTCTHIVNGIR